MTHRFTLVCLFAAALAAAEPSGLIATAIKPFQNRMHAGRRNYAEYAEKLITAIIGDKCYRTFFMEGDFLDVPCLKYSVSKALGYGIMFGSGIMKMPQIIKIMKNRDVTGINAVSFYMECVAFLPSIVYNALKHYPISTYGENVVILAQNMFLVLLYWMYAFSSAVK